MNRPGNTSFAKRFAAVLLLIAFSVSVLAVQSRAVSQPSTVSPPQITSYVLPDGSVYIVGSDAMAAILNEFNTLFTKTHPGSKFTMSLKGPETALPGLTAGVSAFAPLDRSAWSLEIRPFRQIFGYEPTDIHIGRVRFVAAGRPNPPAIYVNAKNPIAGLTVEQVARVFTTGGGERDLTHWGQLGLTGAWANRAIHVYGPRDDGGFATAIRHEQLGGFPFTRRYEPLATNEEIIKAVEDDPFGIALLGPFDSSKIRPPVKLVPLGVSERSFSSGTYQDVFEGKYPFASYLHVYVNRAPGKLLDPFVKEYLRLVLSREGQAIIAAQRNTAAGFVPLNMREVSAELGKLE